MHGVPLGQQGAKGPPHRWQMPLPQMYGAVQELPAQQACSRPPHRQVPLTQVPPALQALPAQQIWFTPPHATHVV